MLSRCEVTGETVLSASDPPTPRQLPQSPFFMQIDYGYCDAGVKSEWARAQLAGKEN